MGITVSLQDGIGSQLQAVDNSQLAGRVSIRPLEWANPLQGNILGHFALTAITGALTGVAANGQIFCKRWADATKFYILMRLAIGAGLTTAFTTGQPMDFELIIARNYTANATGGTQITPAGTAQKMRSSLMGPTIFNSSGEIRIATTGALTAGTQTLDTAGIAYGQVPGNAVGAAGQIELYNWRELGKHPVVLALNEGIVVRMPTAMGAAGVAKVGITSEWAEVASF